MGESECLWEFGVEGSIVVVLRRWTRWTRVEQTRQGSNDPRYQVQHGWCARDASGRSRGRGGGSGEAQVSDPCVVRIGRCSLRLPRGGGGAFTIRSRRRGGISALEMQKRECSSMQMRPKTRCLRTDHKPPRAGLSPHSALSGGPCSLKSPTVRAVEGKLWGPRATGV